MATPILYAGDKVSVKRRGDGTVLTVDARAPRGMHPYLVRLDAQPYETVWCAANSLTLIQRADESTTLPPDIYRTLEKMARQKKVSLAWVVREAAEKYVADQWPLFGKVEREAGQ